MRIAFDMSSVMWTCLSVGKDKEGTEVLNEDGKPYWVNTAAYGYENAINYIVASLNKFNLTPRSAVLVFEGQSSKMMRTMIDRGYKSGRGKRPVEAYTEFNSLKETLSTTLRKLGAICVTQDFVEGDDVLGWLAENTEEGLVIRSNDGDLAVLAGENRYGALVMTHIGDKNVNENPFGPFENKHITVYKALVGDTSDSIKGVKGFGPAAFGDFYRLYGEAGLAELARLAEVGSLDELASECGEKVVSKIFEGASEFLTSWKLAKIHTEWVDTLKHPLQWAPGLIQGATGDERLRKWEGQSHLVSGARWESFKSWARPLIAESEFVALDIETSVPDEGDEWAETSGVAVDVIGSELSGMSLTFGDNLQYTVYIPVDHANTDCVPIEDLADFAMNLGKQLVIQNVAFEGPVLFNAWGERFKNNGYEGFLPDWLDTNLEASYVNENESSGLKKMAKMYFGYGQADYNSVTTLEGPVGSLAGGKYLGEFQKCVKAAVTREVTGEDEEFGADNLITISPAEFVTVERRQYKMRELSAKHVKAYACDDTIVTASLHNFFKLHMQLEHHWQVYLDVEIDASYLHTQSFTHGMKIDVAKVRELEAEDTKTKAAAEGILHTYLIEKGWEGTVAPVFTTLDAPAIKQAALLCGQALKTAVRTPAKLVPMLEDKVLAGLVDVSDSAGVTSYIGKRFTAKPEFNAGSPKQMADLLYTVMGLPVQVFNKTADAAKARGERQGTPKTDELAIQYAMRDAEPEQLEVLKALKLLKMCQTRQGLYYDTYPKLLHWRTGKIHSGHKQAATNTRRASSNSPNIQQLPKHAKIEGQAPRFREVILPHKRKAVIVSMDFSAQELRVIADYSRDENMLDCFVGDNLKDMHALTGLGIAKDEGHSWTYEDLMSRLEDSSHEDHKSAKAFRTLGKKVNFTTEFGAQAPKLAATMLVSEHKAQGFIDAREAAFPRTTEWKEEVIAEAREVGFVTTKLGAKRHLREALNSDDRYVASKAERQAVNFKVQGSSAEQTKLAEGRMWKARLEQRFDCQVIAPIHDEVVFSVGLEDLVSFLPVAHACMVEHYADMQVPTESSISFGPSFGVQIEIGNQPTEEAIAKGLVEMQNMAKGPA